MFKLNRHKSGRSGERIEFKLSNFQAFQIPKGWDRLFLSVVSVDSGKTIAKSSKATVHGGTCQWTDTFSESIWFSQDDASKELEECLYRIIVAMGSVRSGILGEVVLNLTDYKSSIDCGPTSLPLKKCNHGTILQIKVQCHTPKAKFRDRKSWKENTSHNEDSHNNYDDMDNRSDVSDNMLTKSVGSSSSSHVGMNSCQDELGNRETSFSASGSHRSSDSGESYTFRTNFSPLNSLNGGLYIGRQSSAVSNNSATSVGVPGDDLSRSNQSSFNSRASGSLRPSDSSKDLLEVDEETIDELRDEAKMWERHAQKLKLDLDTLKRESSGRTRKQMDLEMELTTTCNERDLLKQEVSQLKSSLEELKRKETANKMVHVQKELEDDMKLQKEASAGLSLQLKKTQEANIELVSILQELEETVEKQGLEIAKLSQNGHDSENEESPGGRRMPDIEAEWANDLAAKEEEIVKLEEKLSVALHAHGSHPDLVKETEDLKAKVQELERDCAELTDENLELIFKLKESTKGDGKGISAYSSILNESYNCSPDDSEYKINLLRLQIDDLEEELKKKEISNEDLTVPLKIQIENLEKKCTDLELELRYFKDQAQNLDIELHKSQEEVQEKIRDFIELQQTCQTFQDAAPGSINSSESQDDQNGNLEEQKHERQIEELKSEIDDLRVGFSSKEKEIDDLRHSNRELEGLLSNVQREKDKLEEDLAIAFNESSCASKSLDDTQNDLMILTTNMESQISINKTLERKTVELESDKHELELHIRELENDNVHLSERISGLEDQLRYLTIEKESSRLELEDSRSVIMDLKDEIKKLQIYLETQKGELEQKLQEAQKQVSESQEESEQLKRSHSELHEHCTHLEVVLNESQKKIFDYCKEVEFLEIKISSLQEEIAFKEKSLVSQLSSTHDEREKIASDALNDAFNLRSDKTKLEISLQEAHAKVKLYETEIHTLCQESENKIQDLVGLVNASKESEEMLMADIERMQRLMESNKSSEEKFRREENELELKLRASDYEKQQIMEDSSSLKVQLQKMEHFQDEILALEGSLDKAKLETGKLEELLQLVSQECEELKTERVSFMEKISNMQKALHDYENDLTAREASYAHEAELKDELSRVKGSNSDYQRKIQCLEEENDATLRKFQLLEKELELKKAEKKDDKFPSKGNNVLQDHMESPQVSKRVDLDSKIHLLEDELAQALESNDMYKLQLSKLLSEKQSDDSDVGKNDPNIDHTGKISSLESELRDMQERYLNMSLQYAEVEAQREQLVMQLKSVKKEKKWFS